MRFITDDGIPLRGDDYREIVRELRRASPYDPSRNEKDYMKAVARRIGSGVRHDRPRDFVEDLVARGFLIAVRRERK
jgi:hypothetical protein